MQVSSYLKNARRSMRHKLIGYMIVLAVLLVAALYAGLTLFGRLSSPKAEIKKALDLQMEVFQNDMESLWHNVSVMSILLSEDMTALLEDTLVQQGLSFEELDGNVEATKAVEDAMLEPLSQYVRQADCSGAFVVLESSMSDGDTADARSGLYVQRANAGRVTNNLLLFRGIASVGKAHNVMPHRKWAQEFHIGQFPNYAEHTMQAAAPIADSRRTTDLVTLPGTSEKAVLLTIPMIGADGTVYGMCGFAINQFFFSAHYDQPSNLSHLACLLTTESGDTLDAGAALMTYTEEGFCYVPPEALTVKPMSSGLVSLNGDGGGKPYRGKGRWNAPHAGGADPERRLQSRCCQKYDADGVAFGAAAVLRRRLLSVSGAPVSRSGASGSGSAAGRGSRRRADGIFRF